MRRLDKYLSGQTQLIITVCAIVGFCILVFLFSTPIIQAF